MSQDETRDDATDESPDDGASQRRPSTYEKIMVAAREAKRLNAVTEDGATLKRKSTTLAMKRVTEDRVAYRFRDRDEVSPPIDGPEFEVDGAE